MGTPLHNNNNNHSFLSLTILLISIAVVLAACTPDPEAQLISPDMIPPGAGDEFVLPTPTPIPNIADMSEDEIFAGLPDEIASLVPADPATGEELAAVNGCTGCHLLDPDEAAAGPTWYNLANRAITRNDNSPAAYLHESIVAPDAYVVEGFSSGIMPQNYEEILSDEDLANLVTYLLTLRGDQ